MKKPLFSLEEMAIMYHNAGFSVFPLWKGTKDKPIIAWKRYMTERATLDEVKDWWSKYPEANIAIVTGKVSGIFVLDTETEFDLSKINIPEGTMSAITGRMGRHFFFKIPEGMEVQTRIEIWGKDPAVKADIKAEGGYVVAAPSYNEQSGNYYILIDDNMEPTMPPQWLLDELVTRKEERNSTKLHELSKGVTEGSRNVSAASFIGHVLLKTDISMWEIVAWPAVVTWNERNSPPIDSDELRATFDSIATREFNRLNGNVSDDELSIYDGPDRVVSSQEMSDTMEARKMEYKMMSGFTPFDNLCDGFVPGEVVVISGPTKNGKTSFLQYLTKLFAEQENPVLWFTYEMSPREFLNHYERFPVFYLPMEHKMYDPKWIERRVIESKKKFDTKIVMIDHIGFVLDAAQSKNLATDLGNVARNLKKIAREQEVVIFAVQHIKKIDQGKEPQLSDVRDSALIAAEADATVMIWRSSNRDDGAKRGPLTYGNDAWIKVVNHRRTGHMDKKFRTSYNNGVFTEIKNSTPTGANKNEDDMAA